MQTPVYSPEEAFIRETFLALMWSLSYPGRIHWLPAEPVPAFQAIGATVLDLETSYFTPDPFLHGVFARSGARALDPERAAYHFYPQMHAEALDVVKFASSGTMLYPDQAATLIIGCTLGAGRARTLAGPGIEGAAQLQVDGIPEAFWEMRTNTNRYPLGWDIFLVDGVQVVGLPRTTQIN
jgi:alpha-D-ribose 1-methylphosphonate 5-triphosphate synthase subunit PhnH